MVDENEIKDQVKAVGNLLRTREAISSKDLKKQVVTLLRLAEELEKLGM